MLSKDTAFQINDVYRHATMKKCWMDFQHISKYMRRLSEPRRSTEKSLIFVKKRVKLQTNPERLCLKLSEIQEKKGNF